MARPTRRWCFVLSLCLLLQQFAPALAVPRHRKGIPYSQWSDVETDAVDKENDESGDKRQLGGFAVLKLLGTRALKAITFGSYGVAFTATVVQAIEGCRASFPSIKSDFDEFKRLQTEYDATKTKIRDESRQASNREIYTNDTYNNYQETRQQMMRISDEATLVLRSMGPEVASLLLNVSDSMERVMEKANQTNAEVDLLQINDKFAEGLELALRLAFPALQLAVPGIKKLWKSHLKKTYIGKKITQFASKLRTKFVSPVTAKAKKTFTKVMSSGFLGRAKAAITAKLNQIVSRVAPKFAKLQGVFSKIRTGIKGLVKLGGAALAVWTAYETFNDCRKKADETRQSVVAMRKNVKDIKGYLGDVKKMNEDVQQSWVQVQNYTLADEMLGALESLKAMILDDNLSKAEDERTNIAEKIQSYIDAKVFDPAAEDTKSELNKRQRDMNEILGIITVTLKCFKYKGLSFDNVKQYCALGDSPFSKVYEDATKEGTMDSRLQCKRRTGEDYISEDAMKLAWKDWVDTNKTVKATCLANNPGIMEDIIDLMRKGKTDPEEITNAVIRTPSKRAASKEEITEIIKTIQAENPDIGNQLPSTIQGWICNLKNKGDSAEEIVQKLNFIVKMEIGRDLTVQDVNKVRC